MTAERAGAAPAADLVAVHTGYTPIATCHWQSMANILTADGVPDALRILCPTWGVGWHGTEVLHGGGRWPALVGALHGVTVQDRHFPDRFACATFENALAATGRAFVAEIDAFHVPSPYQGRDHVVHTVVVTGLSPDTATLLDTTNNPVPVEVPRAHYWLMRESPCIGRLDPYRLYVPAAGSPRTPAPADIVTAVQADLAAHGPTDLHRLDAYRRWYAEHGRAVLPRVGAERFAAAQAWQALHEQGVPGAAEVSAMLGALSDEWFLAHMLADHPRAQHPRQRERIARRLAALREAEAAVHERVRGIAA